jgi:hypothetical protein
MVGLTTFPQHFRSAALNYWRDEAERSWILVNPTSIGDTWCAFALASAFKDAHGGPLTMVVKESQAALAQMFPGPADRIIAWKDHRLHRFCLRLYGMASFDRDEPIIAHPYFFRNDHDIFKLTELFRFPGRGGVKFADQFRLMLKLDWETPLSTPSIPSEWRAEAADYAAEIGLETGRSVILFPDNNSVPPLPADIWQALADELASQGYKVFTNLAGDSRGPRTVPLERTSPIRVTVRLAWPLVELAGRFISMSNGMSAMLLGSGVKAQHDLFLHLPPRGETFRITDIPVADPLVVQSMRFVGFSEGPFREYAIRPGDDNADLIKAVARGDPSRAVTW